MRRSSPAKSSASAAARGPSSSLPITVREVLESFVAAAQTGELADGEMLLVSAAGNDLLLVRVGGEFGAVDSVCTHAPGYLDQGALVGCEVECPLHAGRFDLRTGQATQEPATDPLTTYEVRVEDGTAYIGAARRNG
jgi:naphthalene 1,2-dioxygenase ferredoxin component